VRVACKMVLTIAGR